VNRRLEKRQLLARWLLTWATFVLLAACFACAPAAAPTSAPAQEKPAQPQATPAPVSKPATPNPAPTATHSAAGAPTSAAPPAPLLIEGRLVELEWPGELSIGESDVIRLALVPTHEGYVARAEFPEHDLQTKEVPIPRPNGYTLYAIARLDGVGFEVAPSGDLQRFVPEGEEIAWRWSVSPRQPGQQRLTVQLRLLWQPAAGTVGAPRESLAYGRGIDVQVRSFLGLSRAQAASSGMIAFLFGCGCLLAALTGGKAGAAHRVRPAAGVEQVSPPLRGPQVSPGQGIRLEAEETDLLRSLFTQSAQVVLENEFHSGYSGARTFLVRPIRADGCADALTIVKLGPSEAIRTEFANYEAFVKDRLPPVTARIQRPPVALASYRRTLPTPRAAMQYTFIAEPGRSPVSLGKALRQNPDPVLLQQLFETFGPNWWMQRHAAAFRVEQEYDRLMPPHYVLQPLAGGHPRGAYPTLGEKTDPSTITLQVGDVVALKSFRQVDLRADGQSFSLLGIAQPGRPALRLRWLEVRAPRETVLARVSATRMSLLEEWTAPFERFGLPDPTARLADLLDETLAGTRSVIHGDLNLENVLVGPGSLVWLIDFALTREGHPLFDFAHLESELIAHLLAERAATPAVYLELWRSAEDPLLSCLHGAAGRCLFDPAHPREYSLALFMACMGALKYQNLTPLARHCLFLTAADLSCGL
jgi:hypothetical protein